MIQKSISLEYERISEPLHNSVKWLFARTRATHVRGKGCTLSWGEEQASFDFSQLLTFDSSFLFQSTWQRKPLTTTDPTSSSTLNPKPYTLNPKPQTPPPKPSTPNPKPKNQDPKPPNPKPSTPNPRPQPSTLNTTPQILRSKSGTATHSARTPTP